MASSLLALARERLQIIAAANGYSNQCRVLANVYAADLEFFKRYAPGDFKFLAIGESVLSYAGVNTPTAINAYLYALSSDAGGEALDDWITQLKAAWINAANFPPEELACSTVTFDACETMFEEPSGVMLRARLTCYFPEV